MNIDLSWILGSSWVRTAAAAVVGATATYWSMHRSTLANVELARAQRSLNVSDLSLRILGKAPRHLGEPLEFVLGHPGRSKEPAFYPIPFGIKNAGDRVADGLFLIIHGPKGVLPSSQEIEITASHEIMAGEVAHSTTELGNFRELVVRIPRIYPRTIYQVVLPLILPPTVDVDFDFEAETLDGREVKARARFSLSVVIAATLLIPDQPPVRVDCTFQARPAKSFEELAERTARDLTEKVARRVNEAPRPHRVHLVPRRRAHLGTNVLWFPKFERTSTAGGVAYLVDSHSRPQAAQVFVPCPRDLL